jgi:hypothetical protein
MLLPGPSSASRRIHFAEEHGQPLRATSHAPANSVKNGGQDAA